MIGDLTLSLGLMMVIGYLGGGLAHRFRFPRITGYIVVGVLLGPSLLGVVAAPIVDRLEPFTPVALGIIAYTIGTDLRLDSVRETERAVAWITPLQGLGAWFFTALAIVLAAPLLLDLPDASLQRTYLPIGLVVGAISIATAPAATIALVRELRARGPLTTTLLSIIAIDDALAIVAFVISLELSQALAGLAPTASLANAVAASLLSIGLAIAVGAVVALLLLAVARKVMERSLLLLVVLGAIVLCVGVTESLGASPILANIVVGFAAINATRREEMMAVIDDVEDVVFVVFFVLAGLNFQLAALTTVGLLTLVVLLSRAIGKYLGSWVGARLAGASDPIRSYLGLALLPQAGVSIGLALLAQRAFPEVGVLVFNVVLASTIINELIAPPIAEMVISRAGEQHAE